MAQGPNVEFGDVLVVRETETALLCRIGDKSHWVAHSGLQPGSTVEHPGDLGVLVLPWNFAVEFWDGAIRQPPSSGRTLTVEPPGAYDEHTQSPESCLGYVSSQKVASPRILRAGE